MPPYQSEAKLILEATFLIIITGNKVYVIKSNSNSNCIDFLKKSMPFEPFWTSVLQNQFVYGTSILTWLFVNKNSIVFKRAVQRAPDFVFQWIGLLKKLYESQ